MRDIKKILTIVPIGKILSVALMVFLLSFLTVGNAFLYGSKTTVEKKAPSSEKSDEDGASKRSMNPEEEKSSSRTLGSLTEEYLHEHDHFMHLYITTTAPQHQYIHPHGLGDDHSTLDCPPPDLS
jgi:hypothetical protein